MKWILFSIVLCFAQTASSQLVRDITEHKIDSAIMAEQLSVFVQLPRFYKDNPDHSYPVLYLLDGTEHMTLASGILDPLVGHNNAPQMIIVGLSSKNRDRDFTPTPDTKYAAKSGGADKYLRFIETEAIPFIDKNYRTENFRIFAGHSYGGLLVVHSIYSKPELFNAWFAFSPDLYWQNKAPAKALISFLNDKKDFNGYLYLNIGNEGNPENESPEGKEMLRAIQSIERALCVAEPDGFRHKIDYYQQEPHQVTQIIGTYQAIRSLYPSWDIPRETYLSGYDAMASHFTSLTDMYGYSIKAKDGQLFAAAKHQLQQQNNPLEAIRYITAALQQRPQNIDYMSTLALAYEQARQLPQAVKVLEDITLLLNQQDERYTDIIKRLDAVKELQSKQQ